MIQALPVSPHEGNLELVKFLEQLLTRARRGETTGVILFEVERERQSAKYTCLGVPNRWEELGLIYTLMQRLHG